MIKYIFDYFKSFIPRARFVFDIFKDSILLLSRFFDYIKQPLTLRILPYRKIDVPRSSQYNEFLQAVETDINFIHTIQNDIKDNLLMSWNSVETTIPTPVVETEIYDRSMILEHERALLSAGKITLAVSRFESVLSKIKDKPILVAESSDPRVPVYFGKAWGAYVIGNECSEDGIRPYNDDASVLIDNKDTFLEVEAVVLQEPRPNTTFLQPVIEKDLSLSLIVKMIFSEPVSFNIITIRPYNAASGTYYKLVKVDCSDGLSSAPLNVPETTIINETSILVDIPASMKDKKVRSISLVFKQDTGYFMKYSLGYFKIKNTEGWVDVTGPHVTNTAKEKGGNINENISALMQNIEQWILGYWLPKTTFTETPSLVKSKGENGFLTVQSSESKRKRYAIGITDILIGNNFYHTSSEIVTLPQQIPNKATTVELDVVDTGTVNYYLSFDDGISWHEIIPRGKPDVYGIDLRIKPKKLYINSDLSLKRKKNTNTGETAFVTTTGNKVRLRCVLQLENNIIPSITHWNLVWGTEYE